LRCDPAPLAFAREQLVTANATRQQSFLEQLYLNTSAAETLADDDKQQLVDLLLKCEARPHFCIPIPALTPTLTLAFTTAP
jgi:hypothetical protein